MRNPRPPDGSDISRSQTPKPVGILRARLGAELQKQRQQRGLTQSQLARHAALSLKYVGEIERGTANTTLEVLERLAAAVGWDPADALHGLREPLTEGVRKLLVTIVQQMQGRCGEMQAWLSALDPELDIRAKRYVSTDDQPESGGSRRSRPHRNSSTTPSE
jgi:transcriptional regulator with XRE-family HTH domain